MAAAFNSLAENAHISASQEWPQPLVPSYTCMALSPAKSISQRASPGRFNSNTNDSCKYFGSRPENLTVAASWKNNFTFLNHLGVFLASAASSELYAMIFGAKPNNHRSD